MATGNITYFEPANTKLVCAHLDRSDLFGCMLVSKSWNKELNSPQFQLLFLEALGIKTNTVIQTKIAFKAVFISPINERNYINIFVQTFILFGKNSDMPPYRLSLTHDTTALVSYTQPPFCEKNWYISEFLEDAEEEQIISLANDEEIQRLNSHIN